MKETNRAKDEARRPGYGIDAPYLGWGLLVAFVAALAAWLSLRPIDRDWARTSVSLLGAFLPTLGIVLIGIVLYVKVEKFRHRDRMLRMIRWTGAEEVLDIGTGRGLLMIGAAKRLTTGRSTGIDIWNKQDLSNNNAESCLQNARLEGVMDKITLVHADARKMPFSDGRFDCILSNLCLHNIPGSEGRKEACREIARVLKPGGIALIADFMNTGEYLAEFRRMGWKAKSSYSFLFAPLFLFIVRAEKPLTE
jgi:arsenite methyltransferase